jgi:hypothetical protein
MKEETMAEEEEIKYLQICIGSVEREAQKRKSTKACDGSDQDRRKQTVDLRKNHWSSSSSTTQTTQSFKHSSNPKNQLFRV